MSPSSKEQRSCTLLGPFPPPYSPGRRGARRGEVGGGRKKGEREERVGAEKDDQISIAEMTLM